MKTKAILIVVLCLALSATTKASQVSLSEDFFIMHLDYNYYDTTKDVLPLLLKYDLSHLWTTDFQKFTYGYIGPDFQRLFVHIESAKKDTVNSRGYRVVGKTRVKENICSFSGTFTLQKAVIQKVFEFPHVLQGAVVGTFELHEEKNQKGSGTFQGLFITHWFVDSLGQIAYDSLAAVADGYSNNLFSGSWRSYKTESEKVCNWGDFRVPYSEDLDVGTGEFAPDMKWAKNGWQTYIDGYLRGDPSARKIEQIQWWKK